MNPGPWPRLKVKEPQKEGKFTAKGKTEAEHSDGDASRTLPTAEPDPEKEDSAEKQVLRVRVLILDPFCSENRCL